MLLLFSMNNSTRYERNSNYSLPGIIWVFFRIKTEKKSLFIRNSLPKERPRSHSIGNTADGITKQQLSADTPIKPTEISWMSQHTGKLEKVNYQKLNDFYSLKHCEIIKRGYQNEALNINVSYE